MMPSVHPAVELLFDSNIDKVPIDPAVLLSLSRLLLMLPMCLLMLKLAMLLLLQLSIQLLTLLLLL
jgi:hypothetical protein